MPTTQRAQSRPVRGLPPFIEPQLATLVQTPPSGPGWAHEMKIDGYRLQLRWDGSSALALTRSGLDWTGKFRALADAMRRLPAGTILDGEVAVLDEDGLPSFQALQAALSEGRDQDMVFFVFDLLFEQREDLRSMALEGRKARLKELIARSALGPQIRYVEHFNDGASMLRAAEQLRLEGIVSKPLQAPYRSGRLDWLKSKVRAGQEVVIGGYEHELGRFRSLLVGVYQGEQLHYVGHVGTGFGAKTLGLLWPRLKQEKSDANPFQGVGSPKNRRDIQWVRPTLLAEIEITGWTRNGHIRHASYKGLRTDKAATEANREVAQPGAASSRSQDIGEEVRANRSRYESASARNLLSGPKASRSPLMAAKKKSAGRRKKAAKRSLIAPRGDKRYVRRDANGRIKESDDVGRSLSADRRRRAKRKAKRGQGDKGD